jgi:ArsR family transcriptional regulator, arsenate/arsenite/antimonite-responsive transcriptional repressor
MVVKMVVRFIAKLSNELDQLTEAETWRTGSRLSPTPARLRLIPLVPRENAEVCGCELTDPVGCPSRLSPTLLKILVDAGILARKQRGKWAYDRLAPRP